MTEAEPLQQVERTRVQAGRRKLLYFSGCDYFRLASHPKVWRALHEGLDRFGLNVAASRATTGNHALYAGLEKRLAAFFGAEAAVLVSTGYLGDLVVGQALAGQFSHALIDASAHPALVDATRFLDCPVLQFQHRDAADLKRVAARCGPGAKVLLLTDGMFSRDGSAAPLRAYLEILPRDALLLVDDAHGAGVLGRTGKGTLEHAGVSRGQCIQAVTLSKAFGCYGGAVLCSRRLRQRILERSSAFIGSTPLPLPVASAALTAIHILQHDHAARKRLFANAEYVRKNLQQAGLPIVDQPGPIFPIFPKSEAIARKLKATLLAAGIYPPFLHYPGGPTAGYFRFVLSSEHTREQLDQLLKVLVSTLAKDGSEVKR